LLVIGGGPAGLAAAAVAASRGLRTVLVDERPTVGGQIYRQPGPGFVVHDRRKLGADFRRGQALVDAARRAGARLYTGVSVASLRGTAAVLFGSSPSSSPGSSVARGRFFGDDADLAKMTASTTVTLHAGRVLVAPGAYDRPVVFPGWTLPGVITAGGAQALVKGSRVVPGDRVAFAGSGPLALAFPAQLHHYGVNVVLALEAGPAPGPRSLLALLLASPGNLELLRDGASYRLQLQRSGVALRYRRAIVRAEGKDRVEALVHAAVDENWRAVPGSEEAVAVDTICVGYGFVPSIELFRLAGCDFGYDEDLGGPVVEVDEWRRTSVPGILAAGDGTGVRGAAVAADQGRLAALGAAIDLGFISSMRGASLAGPLWRRLRANERFRHALRPLYRMGQGIYELATPETVVCRCEEVTLASIEQAAEATRDPNVVKSYTRAGMGLCQGRNCQGQVAAVVARRAGLVVPQVPPLTPRPPVRPVPLGTLADDSVRDEGLFVR
jgi:D-hydroxyproline dehydrogenase subunit alpha